jgi:hypothetical protein
VHPDQCPELGELVLLDRDLTKHSNASSSERDARVRGARRVDERGGARHHPKRRPARARASASARGEEGSDDRGRRRGGNGRRELFLQTASGRAARATTMSDARARRSSLIGFCFAPRPSLPSPVSLRARSSGPGLRPSVGSTAARVRAPRARSPRPVALARPASPSSRWGTSPRTQTPSP